MSLFKALIMGLVQGIAEFLPISSSGHLAIFKHILNIDMEAGDMVFDVLLHFGTLVAVFIAFWVDIKKLIIEGFGIIGDWIGNLGLLIYNSTHSEKRKYRKVIRSSYRKFVILILISTIPTGILGILLKDIVEAAAATLIIPGLCLLLTGILLLLADHTRSGKKGPKETSYQEAVMVGTAQGIATLPGLSRSGTTITACLLCGFDKSYAVKYSFIMSIPAILGAMVLELKDFTGMAANNTLLFYYGMGTLVAAIVGYICIKTMLVVVRGKKFKYFSYYCFVVGAIAVVCNFIQ